MHRRPISEIMTASVISVTPDTPMLEALRIIDTRRLSCVVVVEGRRPLGIFTEKDAVILLARTTTFSHHRVDEVMHSPLALFAEVDVREAYQSMAEAEVRHAVVVDDEGFLLGLVTEGDLLHLLSTEHLVEARPVSSVMICSPLRLPHDTALADAAQGMAGCPHGTLLVTQDDRPIGILTERDMVHLIREGRIAGSSRIDEVMSQPVKTVEEDATLQFAAQCMEQDGVRRLAVVDANGRLRGLVTRHEIVKSLQSRYVEFLRDLLSEQQLDLSATRKRLRDTEHELIYRSVMAQVNDAVYVIAPDSGHFIEVNDRACAMLGYSHDELLRLHAWDISEAVDGPEHWAFFTDTLKRGGSKLLETLHHAKDGSLIPVETSLRYVEGAEGRFIVALARDITERKQAEAMLTESRRRYQALFDVIPSGVAVFEAIDDGQDFLIKDFNHAAEHIDRIDREAVIGQRVRSVFPGVDDFGLLEVLRRVWQTGEPEAFPLALYQDEREGGWRENFVYRLASGEVVAIYQDVSDRVHAEQALSASEQRFRTMFEHHGAPMLLIDPEDGAIIDANTAATTFYGYPRGQLLAMSVDDINTLPPEQIKEERLRAAREERKHFVFPHRLASGEIRTVEVHSTPIEGGGKTLLFSILHDITDRQLAEESLRRSEAQLLEAQRIAHLGSWSLDHSSGKLAWSEEVFRIFEIDQERFGASYEAFLAVIHPDDVAEVNQAFNAHLRDGEPYDLIHRLKMLDGRIKYVHEQCETEFDDQGNPLRSLGTVHDVSEIKAAEQRLLETQQMLQLVINTIPHFVFWKDRNSVYLGANERFALSAGVRSAAELIGKRDGELVWHEQAELYQRDDAEVMASGSPRFNYAEPQTTEDGRLIWLETSKMPLRNAHGDTFGVLGIYQDVTSRHENEQQLRQAAAVFENTREGVMITDPEGRIVAVNRAFTEITGYSEQDILGKTPSMIHVSERDPASCHALWAELRAKGHWQGEVSSRRKNGEVYPELLTFSSVRDDEGAVTHYVGVFADISQLKQSEAQLERLAHYDALTQLPNRLLLKSRLEHGIERARRENRQIAVMFIDLDRFKYVNDSLGHPAGDELLVLIAERLHNRLREKDTLARLGGDEFVVILEDLADPDDAARVALKLIEQLSAKAFTLDGGHDVYIGASIGISLFPDDGDRPTDLIRNADSAMYAAKAAGRNTYHFYTEELTRSANERLSLETRLREAIEADELIVHYQPQINRVSGRIMGVEALVRWLHPREGLISPARFIPLAEESGLIVPLGEQVLRKAMIQARAWHLRGHPGLRVCVNLSSRQFQQSDLPEMLRTLLEETGLDPACLELEITESLLLEQGQDALSILERMRALGVRLSIDDFGTGYSSLAYLKRLPIHQLKIDQGFVQGIPADEKDMEIASTIIAMAHNLRLEVLAEGVETKAQHDFLRSRGCDAFQGYLFSQPVPAEAIEALLDMESEAEACTA